jgi:hypothetical protein
VAQHPGRTRALMPLRGISLRGIAARWWLAAQLFIRWAKQGVWGIRPGKDAWA